uniref:Uncharacterized protein n=1 Tax=Solanum tuberosum TaxID=4113 RepID=M1ADK7_SOLTU
MSNLGLLLRFGPPSAHFRSQTPVYTAKVYCCIWVALRLIFVYIGMHTLRIQYISASQVLAIHFPPIIQYSEAYIKVYCCISACIHSVLDFSKTCTSVPACWGTDSKGKKDLGSLWPIRNAK